MLGEGITISCEDCRLQESEACGDCVVTYLLGEDEATIDVAAPELRALRLLQDAGLVPELRHERRAG